MPGRPGGLFGERLSTSFFGPEVTFFRFAIFASSFRIPRAQFYVKYCINCAQLCGKPLSPFLCS